MHCLAIQGAGCARKLRQQARECLNRLVVRFTDDHNLNAHDLDPTEQAPSRGGTPEIDPRVVRENRFKEINDGLGHAAGDTVLASIAARLTAWAGPRAAVGRLGGDEFAVVLELPAERREQRLEQLVRMLHTPVTLDDGRTVDVAASVGAATPDVIGARDLTRLQRAADAALYDGKHSGKAMLATAAHAATPTVNGRRAGRLGTAVWGRAA
ncbi:GGDEF domain-containing protein [Streptomyces albogriseolus]|uniref:GGDEF domain-containing protein n=2 Tax=Streptomyces albogriseolus TaxID=1887 RepID=UPI0034606FA7